MIKNQSRLFVRYRNDAGVPSDRTIEVMETESRHREDYPKITVIIPTSDGYRNGLFPALLRQLAEQNVQDFETIIIKGDPRQGRAINSGADIARGDYILTLDDDTRLHGNKVFEHLIKAMESDPRIGIAGGINIIPEDETAFVKRVMREIPRRSTPPASHIVDSDLAEHPLLMMRRDVFKKVGGENELIPRGLDPYLRQKFRKAGYRVVVVPQANYSHLPPDNLIKIMQQFFRNGKQAAFCNKFYPQWVIETPETHVQKIIAKRPFWYRVARHVVNMVKKMKKWHWIYMIVTVGYALGFIWGYLIYKNEMQA